MQLATEVSSAWQILFLSFAAVVLLLETLRGWRLGLARQVMRAIAIIAAYACAIFGGRTILPITRSLLQLPDAVLARLGGGVLAAVFYVIITAAGTVLFKRTSQQSSAVLRAAYGIGGAALGIAFGTFFIVLAFVGIRLVGSLAEAQVRAEQAVATAPMQPVWNRSIEVASLAPATAPKPSPLVILLARMKTSLEKGTLGARLAQADPIPERTYALLQKLGEVSSNPTAAQRFLTFPGAREISQHPKILALRNDREVMALIAQGDTFGLVQHRRVIEAINDPALLEQIIAFQLDNALGYALATDSRPPRTGGTKHPGP